MKKLLLCIVVILGFTGTTYGADRILSECCPLPCYRWVQVEKVCYYERYVWKWNGCGFVLVKQLVERTYLVWQLERN